jgi:Rieske Fe-S protein
MIGEHPGTPLLLNRRRLLRTAFWATVAGGGAGTILATGHYLWTPPALVAGEVHVHPSLVPGPGAPPVHPYGQPFYLVHLAAGEGLLPSVFGGAPIPSDASPASRAGILVLSDLCTRPYPRSDARCVVAWRPGSDLLRGDLFRCPCCGAAFTRAGIRVFGPAPRSLDTLTARFEPDGTLVVNTTQTVWGGSDNPQRVVPLP